MVGGIIHQEEGWMLTARMGGIMRQEKGWMLTARSKEEGGILLPKGAEGCVCAGSETSFKRLIFMTI